MRKLFLSGIAATFALVTSASMLVAGALTPANAPQGFTSVAAWPALADDERDDGEQGDNGNQRGKNCYNNREHARGWCKHGDGENDRVDRHRQMYSTIINGIVLSENRNFARFRRDDGRVITVNENGSLLNVGQHYSLTGCYQNNVFVMGCNGDYRGGDYQGGNYSHVSGTILTLGGNSVTLAGLPPVTINVSQAIDSGRTNGALTPLRHITAYGYYKGNTFYATTIR